MHAGGCEFEPHPVQSKSAIIKYMDFVYRITQTIFAYFYRFLSLFWFRLEISGTEEIKNLQGPLIIAPNHKTFGDHFLGLAALLQANKNLLPVRAMAADIFFKKFLISPLLKLMGAYPAFRGQGLEVSLAKPLKILEHKGVVVVYPEGKRIPERGLGKFRPGVIELARRSEATPILPILILPEKKMIWQMLPKFSSKVSISFGDAYFPEKNQPVEKILGDLRRRLQKLYQKTETAGKKKRRPRPTLNFFKSFLADFFWLYGPFSRKKKGFAFVVHPRDYQDVLNNLPFLKKFSRSTVLKILRRVWPFTVTEVSGLKSLKDGSEIPGWVIGVPMLARDIMENRDLARKRIIQAALLGAKRGAAVVGLGALTGSVTEGGIGLLSHVPASLTTGRSYTAFIVVEYIQNVIKKLGLEKEKLTVAIVGAAGGVGSSVARRLAGEKFRKMILIDLDRKLDRVKIIFEELKNHPVEIAVSSRVGDVREADIIMTATNAPEAVVQSDDVRPGTVIVDDAQPSDLSPELIKNRDDVIIIEAGVIAAGNLSFWMNFRLANRGEIYCCMGEAMALAASGHEGHYSLGEINSETIEHISKLSRQLGFRLAPYQSFGRLVSEERIQKVGQIIRARHSNFSN